MHRFRDLLDANADHAAHFADAHLEAPPRLGLAVLTCMDARIDAHEAFGLRPGDAHLLRNAGARTTDDMIRSLIKSTNQLGVSRIAVVHHTDCGAAKIELGRLRRAVTDATGHDPDDVEFHLIADEDQAIVDDVDALVACPWLPPGTVVGGFMYDVVTGTIDPRLVREVE
ncbi:beta-class carbonic anhydrase [Rhabdothermincola salaria]|uniref:beta-class carbonic anhydrase n=1 Tax=Rhabdothermincola salaria TaxID=2903142 RepID=UPI001E5E9131|nr:carbonic anhydrase [Rhabdothermincola salaria]